MDILEEESQIIRLIRRCEDCKAIYVNKETDINLIMWHIKRQDDYIDNFKLDFYRTYKCAAFDFNRNGTTKKEKIYIDNIYEHRKRN
jgi:penicillin-binding protein-related factor A (putative recombinase)